jgi:PAS domain S-box-containing protein
VTFPIEASISSTGAGDTAASTLIQRDISIRHAHETEIGRLSRLFSALSGINKAIARSTSREDLEHKVCRALVEEGGFRTAWIGWHDEETSKLVPVAACGDDSDYVRGLQIYSDDRPEGRGPLANAFRQGRLYVCNDLYSDPETKPWIEEVKARELRAGAALPIRVDGVVCGLLVVYAGEVDFFQKPELELLEEAAADFSFALESLAREREHREAEATAQSERKLSDSMFDSMPGVLYLYDEQGRFLRWNRNFETVSGHSAIEIASMHPLDFFAEEDRSLLASRIGEVFARGESSVEAPFLAKDGTATPYFFTGRLVQFEGRNCLVGVGIDLSERKAAELAMRDLNVTLEQRVAERTDQLAAAVERAEAADQMKSAFLATMSHELRTPLNSIIGFTGILFQGLAGPLNAEQGALINDVLDLSKIEAGQLEVRFAPFELGEAIDNTIAYGPSARRQQGSRALRRSHPARLSSWSPTGDVSSRSCSTCSNAIKFTRSSMASRCGSGSQTPGPVSAPRTCRACSSRSGSSIPASPATTKGPASASRSAAGSPRCSAARSQPPASMVAAASSRCGFPCVPDPEPQPAGLSQKGPCSSPARTRPPGPRRDQEAPLDGRRDRHRAATARARSVRASGTGPGGRLAHDAQAAPRIGIEQHRALTAGTGPGRYPQSSMGGPWTTAIAAALAPSRSSARSGRPRRCESRCRPRP